MAGIATAGVMATVGNGSKQQYDMIGSAQEVRWNVQRAYWSHVTMCFDRTDIYGITRTRLRTRTALQALARIPTLPRACL